jgi:predicted Rossmann fold flavoprotein
MSAQTADTIVLGGGAAGMMAAVASARLGRRVILLEGGAKLGRKILISGNGRCNLTNVDADSLRHYHGGHARFVRPALERFPVQATLKWFQQLGIETRQETRGRLFPLSDQARSVVGVLADALGALGVQVIAEARAARVWRQDGLLWVDAGGAHWGASQVIMATGGPSAPKLGADSSGIEAVAKLGHQPTELHPGLVPLISPDPYVHRMQGAKIKAQVSAPVGRKRRAVDYDDLLFTAYGVSGLSILNLSAQVVPLLSRGPVELQVDLFPGQTAEQLSEMLACRWGANPHRSLEKSFLGLLSDKIASPLLERFGLPVQRPVAQVSKAERWTLAQGLHAWPIQVTAPRSLDYAEVTIGGLRTDQIYAETLESRLVPGLYFAGEIVDIHGDLGGYNFQWAWSSGWLAAQAGAQRD